MGPKKKEEAPKKVILGRATNTLKMGLVGMPNVGKSTTFNVLSSLSVPAENYPFCTIDPNTAKVNVPEPRSEKLYEMFNPKSRVLAQISITDIAGLVKGASEGKGLGNAFLSHINGVDGIYHVVRAFDDDEVIHDEGEVDPIRDIETINGELAAKDLQALVKICEDINTRMKRAADKKRDTEELECMAKVEEMLKAGVMVKDGEWSPKEIEFLNQHLFLTSKPVVYLVNIGRDDYIKKKNKYLPKIAEYIKSKGAGPMIPFSAEFESEVHAADPDDKAKQAEAAAALGAESVMDRIIKVGYKRLQLIHYFTAGEDEVRCWTVRVGSKAP